MRLRNLLTQKTLTASLSTNSSASSYGQPAVIVDGQPFDPVGMEIIEISDEEWESLPPHWEPCLSKELYD